MAEIPSQQHLALQRKKCDKIYKTLSKLLLFCRKKLMEMQFPVLLVSISWDWSKLQFTGFQMKRLGVSHCLNQCSAAGGARAHNYDSDFEWKGECYLQTDF